ncbi:MAG: hypothetical protein AB9M53_01510 [Leptothrix sp. (in: b-proteobacteria)]
MKKLLSLIGLLALSVALFVVVFSVVHRPLVIGSIERGLAAKLAYARSLPPGPKLVVFAGSNGRYSHRCAALREALGRPCVNASMSVGLDLEFLLAQWLPLLHAGDLVYMPLEYSQYRLPRSEMQGGQQNAFLVHDHPDQLWAMPPQRIAAAYGSFDLSFLVNGLAEMALDARGVRRRDNGEHDTPEGDIAGHDATKAHAYAEFVRQMAPETSQIPPHSDAIEVVRAFLRQSREAGVSVVGGLPTLPESTVLRDADLAQLRQLYEGEGQRFIELPNHSRYPFECFYDTVYHLNEACQWRHSAALGAALQPLWPAACPSAIRIDTTLVP